MGEMRHHVTPPPFCTKRRHPSMAELVAFCGLDCQTCPIHLATGQQDKAAKARMRTEFAGFCKEHYGIDRAAQDITDCDGCRAENGRLFPASRMCRIRQCARQKHVENCAWCPNYPC
jgi:Protein of unknown function (DUF3795)